MKKPTFDKPGTPLLTPQSSEGGQSQGGAVGIPLIAIVGRPNVGKSTLFNRLVGHRQAIVSEVPGTTRDRITARVEWGDHAFVVVDTGGLEPDPQTDLWRKIRTQVEVAIAEADGIVFLADALDGITPADQEVAHLLRRTGKPVILAVNKVDNLQRQPAVAEFYELGLGDPIPTSAYHNYGIDDLVAAVLEQLPPQTPSPVEEDVMRLAIVGRTNVGKSLLLNAILGAERAIVSDVPGTTRDTTDTLLEYQGQRVLLIDTAGIRRRGRIQPGIERYSVLRAVRAIEGADVVLLVLEALDPGMAQDLHIAGYVMDAYKGIVLVVNKWDLAQEAEVDQEEVLQVVRTRFRFLPYAPVCFTSALKSEGIDEVMAMAAEVNGERLKWVPQEELTKVTMSALAQHPPASVGRRSVRISRPRQERVSPPTFSFAVNYPELVHFSYRRYLENRLRDAFRFRGNHLRLVFKKRVRK